MLNETRTTTTPEQQRMQAFVRELESLHHRVRVDQQLCRGQGWYTLRVHTPLRTIFAQGTEREWREWVEEDLAAQSSITCPFCGEETLWVMHFETCDCGAHISSDVAFLLEGVSLPTEPSDLLHVLKHFDRWVRPVPSREAVAVRNPAVTGRADALNGTGIPCAERVEVPVLVNNRNQDERTDSLRSRQPKSRNVLPATCKHCVHAIEVTDADGSTEATRRCLYPLSRTHTASTLHEHLGPERSFSFRMERRSGNPCPEAIVWNTVLAKLLSHLPDVGESAIASGALEARYAHPYDDFHGPICPAFTLNHDHSDIRGRRLIVLDGATEARFDVVNLDRRRQLSVEVRKAS